MKNLLFIAYYHDQKQEVPSNRTHGFLKYLPEYGWNVTVLTETFDVDKYDGKHVLYSYERKPLLCQIMGSIRKKLSITLSPSQTEATKATPTSAKFNNIRSWLLINGFFFARFFMAYPDQHILWRKTAIKKGLNELNSKNYDAILSTLNPMTAHNIARYLKKRTNLPWVADYRDLWADRHYEKLPNWYYRISLRYEKKVLKSADCLTIVSEPWAERLRELHHLPVEYVSNGFDSEYVNPGIPVNEILTINYTGSLWGSDKYNPHPLFQALSELKYEGRINTNKIQVNFYGSNPQWLTNAIHKYDLEDCVILHSYVSKEEIRTIQCASQVLLLLTWGEKVGDGQYTGKVYEYLAAKRPILAIGARKENVVNGLMERTNAGVFVSDSNEVKKQLLEWYQEYLETGSVQYHGIEEIVNESSYRFIAKKMAKILDEVSERKTN